MLLPLFTARKRSLGQGNIFTSVCQEFFSQWDLPHCMLGYHPLARQTPLARRPPWQGNTPLASQTPPPARQRDPPCAVNAGRYGQQAGGMLPTGMQSC